MVRDNNILEYDEISQIYDVSRYANPETIEKLISVLQVSSDSELLDLGCGTGNYTAALSKEARTVIGLDISKGMIEQARSKFPTLNFHCGDATMLPFDSEMFDGAFAIQVLHNVKEKELLLEEVHRVLKKGGYLAIDSCSHEQMKAFWFYHYFPNGLEVDLKRVPDTTEIISMLERARFSNIESEISYQDVAIEHDNPERYLDKDYRDGTSTFSFLSEEDIKLGCAKLQEDIASGAVESIILTFAEKEATVGGSSIVYGQK